MKFFKNYKSFKELAPKDYFSLAVAIGTIGVNLFAIDGIFRKPE